jgi:hypothetical protein
MNFEDLMRILSEKQSNALAALPTTATLPETPRAPQRVGINLSQAAYIPGTSGLNLGSLPYENLRSSYRNFAAIPIGDLVDYAIKSKARRSALRERMADIDAASKQFITERERALFPYTTTEKYFDILGKATDTSLKEAMAPMALQKAALDIAKTRQEVSSLPATTMTDIAGKISLQALHESQRKLYESMFKESPTLMNMYSSFLGMLSELFGEE